MKRVQFLGARNALAVAFTKCAGTGPGAPIGQRGPRGRTAGRAPDPRLVHVGRQRAERAAIQVALERLELRLLLGAQDREQVLRTRARWPVAPRLRGARAVRG